jgi:hypothetical protein
MEPKMDSLTWEKVGEVQGRLEAELIESYLEAHGVDVELIQEALGHSVIPVMIDGLGRVQIFVPKEKAIEARELLSTFAAGEPEE